MICKNCDSLLLDDPEICPYCGARTDPMSHVKGNLSKRTIILSDILALVMSAINIYLIETAAHYATQFSNGLWDERMRMHALFPALATVDRIFAVVFLILPILTTLSHYFLKKLKRKGVILTVGATEGIVLGSILYPCITYAITGIRSPVIYFSMMLITVYFIFATAFSAYLIKSDRFIY